MHEHERLDRFQPDLTDEVITAATEAEITIGTVESLTGGLLAYSLSRASGAGEAFRGGIVSYHSLVKYELLAVPAGPVVTAEAAFVMARSGRALLDCDLSVALTGVAGPDRQDGQPVGRVFVAIARSNGGSWVGRFDFAGDPDDVRQAAATQGARQLLASLAGR